MCSLKIDVDSMSISHRDVASPPPPRFPAPRAVGAFRWSASRRTGSALAQLLTSAPSTPVLHRLNMRRGLLLNAAKQALIFLVLVALCWSLHMVSVATVMAECPRPPLHPVQLRQQYGRPLGPGFSHPSATDAAAGRTVTIRWARAVLVAMLTCYASREGSACNLRTGSPCPR